jgi:Rrf2 family protein
LKEPRSGTTFSAFAGAGNPAFDLVLRISKKGDYAVFIMGHLAQRGAHAHTDRVVSAQEIATRSGLHKSVVANLLKDLTKAGLLESVRGIHGGYRLGMAAEDISLSRILEVVEGPFVLVDCAEGHGGGESHHADGASACSLMSFCPSMRPMRVLHERIARLMEELRLPELVGAPVFPSPNEQPADATAPAPCP